MHKTLYIKQFVLSYTSIYVLNTERGAWDKQKKQHMRILLSNRENSIIQAQL